MFGAWLGVGGASTAASGGSGKPSRIPRGQVRGRARAGRRGSTSTRRASHAVTFGLAADVSTAPRDLIVYAWP